MKEYNELQEYAELQNDEYGEVCIDLISVLRYCDYLNDDNGEFKQAIEKQINKELSNFKEYSKIVTKTETSERTYMELEWEGL